MSIELGQEAGTPTPCSAPTRPMTGAAELSGNVKGCRQAEAQGAVRSAGAELRSVRRLADGVPHK